MEEFIMERTAPNLVLRRKFIQFLLPTLAIMALGPAEQIVESLFLARILGAQAMASASLASPFLLLITAIYYFIGSGSVSKYTLSLNEGNEEQAVEDFRLAVWLAFFCGFLLMGLCFIFFDPLCHLLCRTQVLYDNFHAYFRNVIFTAPSMIIFLTMTELLIPMGKPGFALISVLIVGIMHIVMNYLFLDVFQIGIRGAALARVGASIAGTLFAIAGNLLHTPRTRWARKRFCIRNLPDQIKSIVMRGNSEGMSVASMAFRFFWTFSIVATTQSVDAVVAFSLCILTASVDSMIQGTLIGASMPLIALLHEQSDYRSAERLLKYTMIIQFLLAALWFILSNIIDRSLISFCGIQDETHIRSTERILFIYSLTYLFRGSYMLFRNYLKILNIQSVKRALFVAGIITTLLFMGISRLGGDALWWSHPMLSLGLLVFTVMGNLEVARRSGGKWKGILLIPQEQEAIRTLNASIDLNREKIAGFGQELQDLCTQYGMESRRAAVCAVAVEELLLYVLEQKSRKDYADIFVRIYDDRTEIDFRTLGAAFQPDEMEILRKISHEISHRNIAGMNCTRLVIAGSRSVLRGC